MILARTWNANESGLLWEAEWIRDAEGRYKRLLIASGVFVPPRIYPDSKSFWAAYEQEKTEFHGRRGRRL